MSKTLRKIGIHACVIFLLLICFGITTYAIVFATRKVENNYFKTGIVDINLNDGKPIIEECEFLFEPGMTVVKDFFVENKSTDEVYYRLYLEEIEGELAKVLEITIRNEDEVIYHGKASELIKDNALSAGILEVDERKDLSIVFYYPKESGNDSQAKNMSFKLSAEASQTRNNPDALFE